MKKAGSLIIEGTGLLIQSSRQKERPEIRQPGAGDLRQRGRDRLKRLDLSQRPFSGRKKAGSLEHYASRNPAEISIDNFLKTQRFFSALFENRGIWKRALVQIGEIPCQTGFKSRLHHSKALLHLWNERISCSHFTRNNGTIIRPNPRKTKIVYT